MSALKLASLVRPIAYLMAGRTGSLDRGSNLLGARVSDEESGAQDLSRTLRARRGISHPESSSNAGTGDSCRPRLLAGVGAPRGHTRRAACGGARLLTGLRAVLPRLAKRYKVPLEVIADDAGDRLRKAGGIGALLK